MSENVLTYENCYYVRRRLHLGLPSGIFYSKLYTATKLCIFKLGFNHVNVGGKIINASGLLLD